MSATILDSKMQGLVRSAADPCKENELREGGSNGEVLKVAYVRYPKGTSKLGPNLPNSLQLRILFP